MKDIEEIMSDFWEDYEEDPKGWTFWNDRSGEFYDIYILKDNEGYFLKLDSIYTQNPIGKGTKIKLGEDNIKDKLPNFGFRKFSEDELQNFLYAAKQTEDSEEETKRILEEKLKEKPSRRSSLEEPGMVMLGPFNTGFPLKEVNEDYQEIQKELKKKLRRKFRRDKTLYR